MTVNSPRTDTPYPVPSDIPDGPSQMSALVLQLEKYAVGKAASTIDRDTRIISPAEGDLCYRTDTHRYQAFKAPSWMDLLALTAPTSPTWTPQIDQGATTNIGKTVNEARHVQLGALVFASFTVTMTGAGTAGAGVTFSLPVAFVVANATGPPLGSGGVFDTSASSWYTGAAFPAGTQNGSLVTGTGNAGSWGSTPSIALAVGDQIRATMLYFV